MHQNVYKVVLESGLKVIFFNISMVHFKAYLAVLSLICRTRDLAPDHGFNPGPCTGSLESWTLGCQGSLEGNILKTSFPSSIFDLFFYNMHY